MQFENNSNEDMWNMTAGVDEGVLEFTELWGLVLQGRLGTTVLHGGGGNRCQKVVKQWVSVRCSAVADLWPWTGVLPAAAGRVESVVASDVESCWWWRHLFFIDVLWSGSSAKPCRRLRDEAEPDWQTTHQTGSCGFLKQRSLNRLKSCWCDFSAQTSLRKKRLSNSSERRTAARRDHLAFLQVSFLENNRLCAVTLPSCSLLINSPSKNGQRS